VPEGVYAVLANPIPNPVMFEQYNLCDDDCMMLHCLHCGDVLSSEPYQEDVAISRIDVQWSFAEMAHHVGTMA